MDLSIYSEKIQNYIREINARRKQTGSLDYDTCQRILEYAAETKSDAIFGIGYYCFAEYYMRRQDTDQTMHCLAECAKCFANADLFEYLPPVYNMMGVVSDKTGNSLIALSYYYTALQYAEEYHATYIHAMADSNVGYILIRMKRYTEAKEHLYSAISYFRKSEDTIYRRKNMIQCMIYCGLCHLLLEEVQEAVVLLERIKEILKDFPECQYSEICFQVFEACCQGASGNMKQAKEMADDLEEAIYREENLDELEDIIVIIADLLTLMKSYKRVESLIRILDEKQIEKKDTIYFDMYPFKSRYLLKYDRMDEYIDYTRQYLSLYERRLEDGKKITARILQLQDKLSRVELEQKDIRAYNRKLASIALYDSMTGLANRSYLNEYLSQKFEEALEKQQLLGVELMDIDHFKAYNDTYGHLEGDICIEAVAKVLKDVQNDKVFCARYGGDEFMIIYSEMTIKEIQQVAETIQRKVRELEMHHEGAGPDAKVTVTQGIFTRIPDEENREWDYNSMADTVLYGAKREGRNRYRIVTEFE